LVELHIAEYRSVINELRQEVDNLKTKLKTKKELKDVKDKEECNYCQCGRQEDEV
jgi:hypothetical protein